ncbi:MAG: porin [Methylotenera sp.]|nr:porin [Methylotenera sp.]
MNNTIKLAVASALLAAASTASAAGGIVAGDWTLDIGGIVNAYYTTTKVTGAATGLALGNPAQKETNITTGLLPNYLSVSGKTRQNDLDVAFTISIQPGSSSSNSGIQGGTGSGDTPRSFQENRQAFLTFGDASWGSIKLGKDLGVYASDAILNDMTLLGVGSGAVFDGNTTTLGHIGTGYVYADWKSQVAYTSPNFNGFSATVAVTQAWNTTDTWALGSAVSTQRGGNQPAFEGKASYAWAGDFAGKVWVSGISQKVEDLESAVGVNSANNSATSRAFDIGANVNVAGIGLTAYYNDGKGMGTTAQLRSGYDLDGTKRNSKDWYLQATYVLPTATKVGVSYGESKLDGTAADDFSQFKNEMWTVGAYHPLTKHLNLVAEYNEAKGTSDLAAIGTNTSGKAKTVSLGAILFF